MTDFLESVLSSMSSAFNSSPSPTPADGASVIDLSLNEDKTLKWRSLYNNSNALKSGSKKGGNNNHNNCVEQQQQHQQQTQQQQQQQQAKLKFTRENKMSQGQDNSNNNEIISNKHENHNNNGDKVKINAKSITTTTAVIKKKNQNVNNSRKITRRRKNLQNEIKRLLDNSTSASRRTRRSHSLEPLLISNESGNKRMLSTSNTVVTTDNKLNTIRKRRGRSKKLIDHNHQNSVNNSPKKLQNVVTGKSTTTNSVTTAGDNNIKAESSSDKVNESIITPTASSPETNKKHLSSGNGRQHSPSGRQQSPSSGRKLRRSERNSIPDEIKIEEPELMVVIPLTPVKISNDGNVIDGGGGGGVDETITTEPKGKRIRRSERLESRYETEDSVNKTSSSTTPILQEPVEVKEEPRKSPKVEIPTLNDDETDKKPPSVSVTITEATPKRRGRRTKIITPEKPLIPSEMNPVVAISKKSRSTKEFLGGGDTESSSTRKEKTIEPPAPVVPIPAPISQRPLRRIKPTAKILENDELRYEFETKNIARITACSDFLATTVTPSTLVSSADSETSSVNSSKVKKEQKDNASQKELQSKASTSSSLSSSTSKDSSLKLLLPPPPLPPLSQPPPSFSASTSVNAKRKLFPPIENNLNVDNIYPVSLSRPCPDPETFISEIKTAKINLNKSPESKKMNRKQYRKLMKQKEKHFEKLGLRKNMKDDRTETEDSSSDNEEFLPPKKLNVGKPNVTLRLRNKENSPVSSLPKLQQKIQKKRTNSRLSSSNGSGGSAKGSNDVASIDVGKLSLQLTSSQIEQIPPVSPLRKDIKKEQSMICLCQKSSQYYTRNTPETAFCCAIDSIEDEKVGCCNQLSGELLNLLRPSHRVGYMILCDDHKKRLLAHNCCASCGIFCTQGKFILCKQEHFFHADCAQKYILNTPYDPTNTVTTYPSPILVLKCPHCGCDTPEKTSLVTMKCNSLPVFLPSQRALIKPAKMSVPEGELLDGRSRRRFPSVIEMDKLIPESVMNIASQRQSENNGTTTDSNGEILFTSKDMFYAINNDDLERVAEIIASGYDITSRMSEFLDGTCLHLVAHFGTVQMAYLLLCRESSEHFLNMIDKELRTPSMCAVFGDKCDILKLFIQFGADLSLKGSDGMTCLHMAAKLGSIAAAQLIVESYKNCTSVMNFKKFINAQDDGGWTAMVWAAENGYTDIVSYLISHGADPNVCDTENNTVLHWATLSNRVETIMVLLQANINCNQQNINGDTPLHIACRQSSTRVCLMLIANGSDLVIKNRASELPYDCIPNEESQCARAVGFNMQMRSFGATGLRNKVICSDISNGRETHPIQAVRAERITASRTIDHDDDIMMPDFKYITKNILLQNSIQIDQRVSQMRICSCNDGCNTDECQCSTISVQNWYTPEGRLNNEFCFDDPPMIFECNDVCGCNKLICKNRVVQNGIKVPLQVFECEQRLKGWGVRSLIQIPRGTFVSEYTGEILTDLEADRRTDDSYFFDLGASDHCIDANYYGNISRFYNHSCSPNIVPVRVYYDHQDYRFPKIAFFACKDILAGEELAFDYGDKFWAVKQKYFSCQCKSSNCRYSSSNNTNTNNSSAAIPVTG